MNTRILLSYRGQSLCVVHSCTEDNICYSFRICTKSRNWNIIWVCRQVEIRPGGKDLSLSLRGGCGGSLLTCRALVYFSWYDFRASNHLIKALHPIYPSSNISDSQQLFPTPAAKTWMNMSTLSACDGLFLASEEWHNARPVFRHISRMKFFLHVIHRSGAACKRVCTLSTFKWSRRTLFLWKPHTQPAGNGFRKKPRPYY